METVAISGIGKRNSLIRLVKAEAARAGLGVLGLDASPWPPARPEVDVFEVIPKAGDPEFAARYAHCLREHNSALHFTLVDPEIPILGALAETPEAPSSRFMHPVRATSGLCEDKFRFHEVLSAKGIPTVPTYLEPPRETPFIQKDRTGSSASGFAVYRDPAEAARLRAEAGADLIYQPFIDGTHFCVDAYFGLEDGALIDLCVKIVHSKKAGESYLLESADPGGVPQLLRDLAGAIDLRGLVNLDIYEVAPGDLRIMEVNCRIGGNYPASHALGVNLLEHAFAEVIHGARSRPWSGPRYRFGQRVGKYFAFTDVF